MLYITYNKHIIIITILLLYDLACNDNFVQNLTIPFTNCKSCIVKSSPVVFNELTSIAQVLHNNIEQEAQLSQRDRAMLHVIEDFAKSLKITRNDTAA